MSESFKRRLSKIIGKEKNGRTDSQELPRVHHFASLNLLIYIAWPEAVLAFTGMWRALLSM